MITIRQRLGKLKNRIKTKRIPRRKSRNRRLSLIKGHSHTGFAQKLLEQATASFNQGFDAGYDEALIKSGKSESGRDQAKSSDEAYKKGLYDGGEGIVDTILPDLELLPDISVRQIIEAGIEHLSPRIHRLLSATDISGLMISAMNSISPLSIVRLGDGELLTLAQEVVMSEDLVRKEGHFLNYAGVHLPDLAARDQLVQAITKADIVGIPKLRLPNFQPLAFATLKAHGIHYRQLRMTLSTINYTLYLEGFFRGILENRRVLVVGNSSPGLAQVLLNSGIDVIGAVSPVKGIPDIPRVMGEIAVHDFDIALVGAGVSAVIIVERIASELGKVAIDFGHLADSFVKGEAVL